MKSIAIREIKSFFGSPIGYLVIAIFLLLNGLFLWIFDGEYNILQSGFADLTPFFTLAPWILIFLIPAVTMRSFSDERKQGTIELLLTKPLSVWQIVNGKFLGAFLLIVIAIIPTFIYVYVISFLGFNSNSIDNLILPLSTLLLYFILYYTLKKFLYVRIKPLRSNVKKIILILHILIVIKILIKIFFSFYLVESIDFGSIMGSYFGLLFLVAAYTSIGIFTSTLSENQIVAFIVSVFLCFLFYYGFEGLTTLFKSQSDVVALLGMDYHYKSMSRGVLDSRDILYFVSVAILFLTLTVYKLKSIK